MSIDILDTRLLLYFVKKMSEHRYDIRISESCVDPNPLMVERQDPDKFTRFQTRERCALEITAYVFKDRIIKMTKCVTPERFILNYAQKMLWWD